MIWGVYGVNLPTTKQGEHKMKTNVKEYVNAVARLVKHAGLNVNDYLLIDVYAHYCQGHSSLLCFQQMTNYPRA